MHILAISASPRRGGNSDVLCDEFLKGAAESGHDVQKIRLAEKKSRPVWPAMPAAKATSACAEMTWPTCWRP